MTVDAKNDIMNSALVLLGQRPATSPTEQTGVSQFANDRYDTVRDFVLVGGNWNCATTRASLSALSNAPAFGFAKQFALPGDFLRFVRFEEDARENIQYRIEAVSDGTGGATRVLLTDSTDAKIVYIFRLTEVAKMDELLKYAISARLAYEISLAVKGDIQQTNFFKSISEEAMSLANFVDADQASVEVMTGSLWLDSRRSGDGSFRSIENATS